MRSVGIFSYAVNSAEMEAKRARTATYGTHVEHIYRPGAADGVFEDVPDGRYAADNHPVKAENPGRVVLERYVVHDEELNEKTIDHAKALSTPPQPGSEEAADLAECTEPGRMLMLLMDENGRTKRLPVVAIAGRDFRGTVTLAAVNHTCGYECWTDVTPADVAAMDSHMRAREEEAERGIREAEAAGYPVFGWP